MTETLSRRGRPRPGDVAERDRRVEAAAWAVFREQGYGRATIDEISRRAGVAKRTLYGVYGGKGNLFERVVSAAADPTPEAEAFDGLSDAAAVLRAVAAKVLATSSENHNADLMRLIIAEAPSQPQLASQVRTNGRERVIRSLAGVFDSLFRRKLLAPPIDAEVAAALFVDVVLGAATLHKLCYVEEDLGPFLDRLIAFFIAGFPAWGGSAAHAKTPRRNDRQGAMAGMEGEPTNDR